MPFALCVALPASHSSNLLLDRLWCCGAAVALPVGWLVHVIVALSSLRAFAPPIRICGRHDPTRVRSCLRLPAPLRLCASCAVVCCSWIFVLVLLRARPLPLVSDECAGHDVYRAPPNGSARLLSALGCTSARRPPVHRPQVQPRDCANSSTSQGASEDIPSLAPPVGVTRVHVVASNAQRTQAQI